MWVLTIPQWVVRIRGMAKDQLTADDEKCIQLWMKNGGNRTAAYRQAFQKRCKRWTDKTVNEKASRFFSSDKIQARIAQISVAAQESTQVNAEWVLKQAVELHLRCMQEISPVMVRDGREMVQLIDEEGREVFQFDSKGAAQALSLIGKHVNVEAFSTRIDVHHHKDATDRLAAARNRMTHDSDQPSVH